VLTRKTPGNIWEPIGRRRPIRLLEWNGEFADFEVTGIFASARDSHLRFILLISMASYPAETWRKPAGGAISFTRTFSSGRTPLRPAPRIQSS